MLDYGGSGSPRNCSGHKMQRATVGFDFNSLCLRSTYSAQSETSNGSNGCTQWIITMKDVKQVAFSCLHVGRYRLQVAVGRPEKLVKVRNIMKGLRCSSQC